MVEWLRARRVVCELVGWWGGCVVDGLVGGVTDAGAVEGGVGLWLVVKGVDGGA